MKILPVVGFEDAYQVSDEGEVYSIERVVLGSDGIEYPFPAGKRAKSANIQNQYFMVCLYKNNVGYQKYVHRLVSEAFIPRIPGKPAVNHIDGDRQNNKVENLEWVTYSENSQHAVDTQLHIYTNRLTESAFLSCLQEVIAGESYLSLSQRVPYKVPFLSVKLRRLAKKHNLEHLLDASLMQQRQRRARINGAKSNQY